MCVCVCIINYSAEFSSLDQETGFQSQDESFKRLKNDS